MRNASARRVEQTMPDVNGRFSQQENLRSELCCGKRCKFWLMDRIHPFIHLLYPRVPEPIRHHLVLLLFHEGSTESSPN